MGIHNYHRYLFGSAMASSHLSNWEVIIEGEPTSIWQRLWYFINTWRYLYLWVNAYASVEQEIVKKHLGNDMPNIIDIARNMSILLVNENPAYGYVKLEQPNAVFFSGFHINKTPPPLPKVSKLRNDYYLFPYSRSVCVRQLSVFKLHYFVINLYNKFKLMTRT